MKNVAIGYGQFEVAGRAILAHQASHRIYNTHDPITADKPFVLHSCDRPVCVQPAHLHAGTPADNVREMMDRGRIVVLRGEESSVSKLTEPDVAFIRQSELATSDLARMFDISETTIYCVRKRKTWKHL